MTYKLQIFLCEDWFTSDSSYTDIDDVENEIENLTENGVKGIRVLVIPCDN